MHLSPGTQLDRYEIEGVVGQGSRAIVYAARHTQLGSRHALKVVRVPGRAGAERVMVEGRAQSLLHHPNIVAVTDVIDVWGSPGLVMELVHGPTLADALSSRRLDLAQVDDLARGILAGVAAAHTAGLVHRDLKPANILLEPSEVGIVPKVTDFGLAKIVGESLGLTARGAVLGTPAYMAPEQTEDSSSVDARADIFALGAILYEMVTGQRAFAGDDVGAVIMAIREGRYPPLDDVVPDLPRPMYNAITRALRVDRSERCRETAILLSTWIGDPGERTGRVAPDRVWTDQAVHHLRDLWQSRPESGPVTTPTPPSVDIRVQAPDRDARFGIVVGGAVFAVVVGLGVWAVGRGGDPQPAPEAEPTAEPAPEPVAQDRFAEARSEMVRTTIEARGVSDPEVLRAMRTVPRHRYMPEETWAYAYADHPVPIGEGQTISQPYIVAFMTEKAQVEPGDKVLEVGTGSGYQAAVLAEIGADVYSIEIVEPLARQARAALDATGYGKVHTRVGDGYRGWPEAAPFDAIVVTAAPGHVPEPLEEQLADGGVMVIPVGTHRQELMVIERKGKSLKRSSVLPVMFVPMTGEAQEQ